MCKFDTCKGARNVKLFRLETWKELPLRFASRPTFDYNLTPLSFPLPPFAVRIPLEYFFHLGITSIPELKSPLTYIFPPVKASQSDWFFPSRLPLYREYYFPVTIAAKTWTKPTFLCHSLWCRDWDWNNERTTGQTAGSWGDFVT